MNAVDKIFQDSKNDPVEFSKKYTAYLSSLLDKLDHKSVADFICTLLEARETGKRIFFIGNGGSAATASHFANDIGIGTRTFDKPFKAISLTDNNAVMTAIGNDDGYDHIFLQQLQVQMEDGDIVVAISASGNSENVLKAMDYAKTRNGKTVAIVGFDGGKCAGRADLTLLIETAKGEYGPVEDMHMILDHLVGAYLMRVIKT